MNVYKNDRYFYIFKEGMYVKSEFESLRRGNTFRVFEANGHRLVHQGTVTFVAAGDPQPDGSILIRAEER